MNIWQKIANFCFGWEYIAYNTTFSSIMISRIQTSPNGDRFVTHNYTTYYLHTGFIYEDISCERKGKAYRLLTEVKEENEK